MISFIKIFFSELEMVKFIMYSRMNIIFVFENINNMFSNNGIKMFDKFFFIGIE